MFNQKGSTLILGIIIGVLAVLAIGAAYYFGKSSNSQSGTSVFNAQASPAASVIPQVSAMPTPATSAAQSSLTSADADKTVQDYYNWYDSCLNAHMGSANVDCPYNKTGALTIDLFNKLQLVKMADPVICAQNFPDKITYEPAVMANGTATAEVHTVWGSPPQGNIRVGLTQINNQWKISSIDCNK